jgi:hypothetical protein
VTDVGIREIWCGRVWRAVPMHLVDDAGGTCVLWHPEGVPVKRPFAGARELRIPGDEDWTLEDRPEETECLVFLRPGARHSLWLMWRDGVFRSWYVNFERESKRHGALIDIVDEKLDLVVDPDGTARLKDEDELHEAARRGYLDAAEVRRELARVLADPPWPTGWEDWRPDPSWPMPALPDGWDAI